MMLKPAIHQLQPQIYLYRHTLPLYLTHVGPTPFSYVTIQGSYTVKLPDGRTQIVTYTVADDDSGFVAEVIFLIF